MAHRTTIPEADAQLVEWKKNSSTQTITIIRKWPDVDATAADTLVAAQPSSVTDPQADAQTYSGDYQALTNRARGDDDRSVTIIQTLTRTYHTGESPAVAPALTITYYEDSQEQVERKLYFDLTLDQVNTLIEAQKPVEANTAGITWRPQLSGGSQEGAFDLTLEKRTARSLDTGWKALTDSNGTFEHRVFYGLTATEVDAIRATITSSYQGRVNEAYMPHTARYSGSAWRGPAQWSIGGFDTPVNHDYTMTVESGTYHIYLRYSTSPLNLASWMRTAPVGDTERVGTHTAGIVYMGKGVHRATKIDKTA